MQHVRCYLKETEVGRNDFRELTVHFMNYLPYRILINYGIVVQIVARSYCLILLTQSSNFFLNYETIYTPTTNIGSTIMILKTEEYCTVEGTVPTAVQEPISNRVQSTSFIYNIKSQRI